jgi:hypothetical protein
MSSPYLEIEAKFNSLDLIFAKRNLIHPNYGSPIPI